MPEKTASTTLEAELETLRNGLTELCEISASLESRLSGVLVPEPKPTGVLKETSACTSLTGEIEAFNTVLLRVRTNLTSIHHRVDLPTSDYYGPTKAGEN